VRIESGPAGNAAHDVYFSRVFFVGAVLRGRSSGAFIRSAGGHGGPPLQLLIRFLKPEAFAHRVDRLGL
jgi:hypothetical protein